MDVLLYTLCGSRAGFFAYAYSVGGLYEEPFSFHENSRAVFRCFLGAGTAELAHSLLEELSKFSKKYATRKIFSNNKGVIDLECYNTGNYHA